MMIAHPFSILTVAIMALWMGRRFFGFWVNPIALWVVPWSITVSLFSLGLLSFEPLAASTLLAISLSSVGFVLGAACVALAVRLRGGWSLAPEWEPVAGSNRLFIGSVTIGCISSLLLLALALQTFGVSGLLGAELRMTRTDTQLPFSVPLTAGFHLLLPASVLSGLRIGHRNRVDVWDMLIPLGVLLYGFVLAGRTVLLFWMLLVAAGAVAARQRRGLHFSLWKAVGYLLLAVVVFGGVFVVLGVMRGSFAAFAVSRMPYGFPSSPVSVVFLNAYVYATSSLASFNHFVTHFNDAHSLWTSVAHPITYQLAKLDLAEIQFFQGLSQAAADTPGGSNVYSILRAFYLDLGLAGCFIYSFLLGLLTSVTYAKFRLQGSIPALLAFGYMAVLSFASPYEYMLYGSIQLFAFLVVAVPLIRLRLPTVPGTADPGGATGDV